MMFGLGGCIDIPLVNAGRLFVVQAKFDEIAWLPISTELLWIERRILWL